MAKIPKQFRVVFKEQSYHEYIDGEVIRTPAPRLGFANVYEPHVKAYEKRCKTQDDWAYGEYWHTGPEHPSQFERDGKIWISRKEWVKDDSGAHVPHYTESVVKDELQPIIIDNESLEGFVIQKSVSRCSTSNKLWRILDPRGFELEINTYNMEELIMTGDISNGLIVGKCIWAGPKTLVRCP